MEEIFPFTNFPFDLNDYCDIGAEISNLQEERQSGEDEVKNEIHQERSSFRKSLDTNHPSSTSVSY